MTGMSYPRFSDGGGQYPVRYALYVPPPSQRTEKDPFYLLITQTFSISRVLAVSLISKLLRRKLESTQRTGELYVRTLSPGNALRVLGISEVLLTLQIPGDGKATGTGLVSIKEFRIAGTGGLHLEPERWRMPTGWSSTAGLLLSRQSNSVGLFEDVRNSLTPWRKTLASWYRGYMAQGQFVGGMTGRERYFASKCFPTIE